MSDAVNPPAKKSLPVKAADAPAFLVSSSPHLAAGATTRQIMFEVVAAMAPLFVVAVIMFRQYAFFITIPCVLGCLAAEAFANRLRGRSMSSLADGSAIVTGMILAFSLPPALNPYMAFIGWGRRHSAGQGRLWRAWSEPVQSGDGRTRVSDDLFSGGDGHVDRTDNAGPCR